MFYIPLNKILPNPDQPRKNFDQIELENLAQSIRENGILQPVLVEQSIDDTYIFCDGERRMRAAKMAGLAEIPAMILSPSNDNDQKNRAIMALVANLQRKDLNPIEEARTYQKILEQDGITVRFLSKKIGIYEQRIYNSLILLELDEPLQKLIERGELTTNTNTIRLILGIPSSASRIDLCKKLAAKGLGKNIKAVNNSTNLLIKRLKNNGLYPSFQAPSAELAMKKEKIDLPKWDIFYQAGKVPSWPIIYKSALEACNNCPLRPAACENTCKNCVGVNFLAQMIKLGNQEKAHNLAHRVIKQRALAHGRG